ncbi:hypothetical protein [Polyangium aurulentum]|jgi:hypothetical protein|uniref:hypothetical protein n=1 Tax=Polyangium aurulentum TaxID=2567896 RepID=UPI0010AE102E|nr:hypothetical protein [Polyangium aurulentum]UQA60678.1 hypothetical protein E8A73_009450 [Polyangium aurulentum]
MGQQLMRIVEQVRAKSRGFPNLDLARLNLLTGQPLSRKAFEIPDDPKVVAAAQAAAREILEGKRSR